jgi:hypothetical protein
MRRASRTAVLVAAALLVGALAVGPGGPTASSGQATDRDAAGKVVAARAGGGMSKPCGRLDVATEPYVRGGCRLRFSSLEIDVWSRTAFGRIPFSYDCSFTFDLRVASDGSTTMDRLLFGGALGGCGDIRPCEPDALTPSRDDRRGLGQADHSPWRGRLVALGDGRFANRAKACFDTCAGRFDGKLEIVLQRRGGRWIGLATRAPVGATGMELDGRWYVEGDLVLGGSAAVSN